MDYLRKDGLKPLEKGDTTQQAVERLMITSPGQWRSHPLAGMALRSFLMGPDSVASRSKMKQEIQLGLKAEQIIPSNLQVNPGFIIDLELESNG